MPKAKTKRHVYGGDIPMIRRFSTAVGVFMVAACAVVLADNHAGFGDDLAAYEARVVTQSLLLDGTHVAGKLVAVGEHGHIIVSTDDGKSWQQAAVPTRSALTGVAFANDNIGFAVGHDAIILRTTDGANTWERVHFDPDLQMPLLDVWMADASNGFAIGAYGLFLETSDGGTTWTRRPFFSEPLPVPEGEEPPEDDEDYYVDPEYGEDRHLNHITSAADGTLYIAAEAGNYYRSQDRGATWTRLKPPYNGSFFGTLPLAGDSLLLFGMRGNLFRSDDAGLTYRSLPTNVEALLTSAFRAADGRIMLTGLAGVLLESVDDGATFTLHRQRDRRGSMMALPANDASIVLIGEGGVTLLTPSDYRAGGVQ